MPRVQPRGMAARLAQDTQKTAGFCNVDHCNDLSEAPSHHEKILGGWISGRGAPCALLMGALIALVLSGPALRTLMLSPQDQISRCVLSDIDIIVSVNAYTKAKIAFYPKNIEIMEASKNRESATRKCGSAEKIYYCNRLQFLPEHIGMYPRHQRNVLIVGMRGFIPRLAIANSDLCDFSGSFTPIVYGQYDELSIFGD
jgi:hypothetical protein